MKRVSVEGLRQQEKVRAYFQSQSSYWKDIYSHKGVYAEIHRDRQALVLDWIDNLALAPGSKVLEIGCGAGLMAATLAQGGYEVHAIDSSEAMVEQTRQHALRLEVADRLSVDVGDACALAFEDASFDLVTAIGVIPWLEQPEPAIREMARVTRPGGYIILTADNRARLNHLLDPSLNPLWIPLKRRVKAALERFGFRRSVGATLHSRRFIDGTLASAELIKHKSTTLGFGPFSLMHFTILPEPLGIAFYHRLQHLADRNVPVFRSTGAQYLVLARKSTSRPLIQSTGKSVSELQISYDQQMEVLS